MFPREFSQQLRSRLADGLTFDAALRELRASGASIIECIRATKRVRGCDLAEAKRLIHDSTAWADVVERTDAMQDELAEILDRNVEPDAAPNAGPAMQSGKSGVMEGPPSLS